MNLRELIYVFLQKNRLDFVFDALLLFEKHRNVTLKRQQHSKQLQYMNYRTQVAHRKHKLSLDLDQEEFRYDPVDKLFRYNGYEINEGTCTDCSINCFHICTRCKVCKYRYVCSCLSFASKKEFCKHVHIAHRLYEVMRENNSDGSLEGERSTIEKPTDQNERNNRKNTTSSTVIINSIDPKEVKLSKVYKENVVQKPFEDTYLGNVYRQNGIKLNIYIKFET